MLAVADTEGNMLACDDAVGDALALDVAVMLKHTDPSDDATVPEPHNVHITAPARATLPLGH